MSKLDSTQSKTCITLCVSVTGFHDSGQILESFKRHFILVPSLVLG